LLMASSLLLRSMILLSSIALGPPSAVIARSIRAGLTAEQSMCGPIIRDELVAVRSRTPTMLLELHSGHSRAGEDVSVPHDFLTISSIINRTGMMTSTDQSTSRSANGAVARCVSSSLMTSSASYTSDTRPQSYAVPRAARSGDDSRGDCHVSRDRCARSSPSIAHSYTDGSAATWHPRLGARR
jgi:hypothetical protein